MDAQELVELGVTSPPLWAVAAFPRAMRGAPPPFHSALWRLLTSPDRLCCLLCFRGSGKTTLLRAFTLWRIAYGLSKVVLFVSRSQANAERSLQWIRAQVEDNQILRYIYQLDKGSRWTSTEAQIITPFGPSWITAAGITGQIRGLNFDDYRPDLIVLDDPLDDENAATAEQRRKIRDLIHGALRQSLAPPGDAPHAKLVMLQTPLHREDAAMEALRDPEWRTARFGCWTPETEDLPIDEQVSAWPERFPTPALRHEKRAAIAANRLPVFAREMECRLISAETSAFRREWLRIYEGAPPERKDFESVVIGVDPSPPPSDRQLAAGLRRKDPEVWTVWGRDREGRFWLLDLRSTLDVSPSRSVETFFTLGLQWRPNAFLIESIAYQQTLLALLKSAMVERRLFFVIREIKDRRPKYERVTQAFLPLASNNRLFIPSWATEFLSQYEQYPDVAHDDILDASAFALEFLAFESAASEPLKPLSYGGFCP